MAEKVFTLPPLKNRGTPAIHAELMTQISDGDWWKVTPAEYAPSKKENFRCATQAWARKRKLRANTRSDDKGNLYVQMVPDPRQRYQPEAHTGPVRETAPERGERNDDDDDPFFDISSSDREPTDAELTDIERRIFGTEASGRQVLRQGLAAERR